MKKQTIYGLPLNPMPALEQLKGASFCVSYAHRAKLGRQLDDAVRLVGEDGILMLDNGAYTHWKQGGKMTDAYVEEFADWANEILDRCPQAWFVYPDIIEGSVEENWKLVCESMMLFSDSDRGIPVWHMHEPIEYLIHLCQSFPYIAFGSTADAPGSAKWHARIKEAFAAIDRYILEGEGAYVRPRIHMMRAQNYAHLYPFDSSDSTNVAMNHNRQLKKSGEDLTKFAARVDGKIQASAGPEAEHQIKRPLLDHLEQSAWELQQFLRAAGYETEPSWPRQLEKCA